MEKLTHSVTESGLVEKTYLDHDGKLVVRHEQDLTRAGTMVEKMRHSEDLWRQGVKNSMVYAAHLEDIHVHQLLQIGINVYTDPWPDIRKGIYKLGIENECLATRKKV